MACGCAVILTDAGGVNEYAKPNKNCLMYEPKNITELKEKLLLLIYNPDLRKKLSQNGLETAKEFSWGKSAEQLEIILGKFEAE
jgi:glycosyltransferase involved in cell wall biosynthesis